MSSVVFICNLALANLGKPGISDIAEPSAEATACRRFYDHTRDTLLQVYPWRFAGAKVALAQVANDRPGEWGYAYVKPTDCLKARWVEPVYSETNPAPQDGDAAASVRHPHEIEGGRVYCDLSPAVLRYTRRLTDPTRFSPLFIDALAWHLAVRLAMPMTRDPKVRADAYQLAMRMQAMAEAADANETRHSSDHAGDILAGRG
ncbi:MAG: hypothetical protein KYX69_19635 [Sphingomonas sp.]|uniref:hypothetical protein n=1 Tax=Sphingomonas sp. TaxID=28214 RepID=UPI002603183E|nr:hypothetical protein [Sphingomonas sp.]MDK2769916.1 hypothetical protein [Sphingomonas sp.]